MNSTLRLLIQLALPGMLLGCATSPTGNIAAEPHAMSSLPTTRTDQTKTVTIVGILTRKGPDIDSWWAVTSDEGVVWKLELADENQAALLQRMQNNPVRVQGVTAGFMLAFPILKVARIELLR
jgi:hypothetical protein